MTAPYLIRFRVSAIFWNFREILNTLRLLWTFISHDIHFFGICEIWSRKSLFSVCVCAFWDFNFKRTYTYTFVRNSEYFILKKFTPIGHLQNEILAKSKNWNTIIREIPKFYTREICSQGVSICLVLVVNEIRVPSIFDCRYKN